jgi:predicted kinase
VNRVPADALIVLVGVAGSGKSTLAARLFRADQVLSSDAFRRDVSGDPADQTATAEAFRRLHDKLGARLAAGQLTVVDATSVERWARNRFLEAARRHGRPAIALVLAVPLEVALAQNAARAGRLVPPSVIRRQDRALRASLESLPGEGFDRVMVLSTADEVAATQIWAQRNAPKEQHPVI